MKKFTSFKIGIDPIIGVPAARYAVTLDNEQLRRVARAFRNAREAVGEDIDIAFNPKYCMNILKVIKDETVYMDFLSPISPCVVRPVQGDRYYYLIVPVRIYSQF